MKNSAIFFRAIGAILFFMASLDAAAARFRVSFEANGNAQWVNLYYTKGAGQPQIVEPMRNIGGTLWSVDFSADEDVLYCAFAKSGSTMSSFFNIGDSGYNVYFKETATVEPANKEVLYFDFEDRRNWSSKGLSSNSYISDEGPLFNVWWSNGANVSANIYSLGQKDGGSSAGAPVLSYAVAYPKGKSPVVWIYRTDEPSNAVVSAVAEGMLLRQPEGEDVARSVYATWRKPHDPDFRFDCLALPYADGEYSVECVLPGTLTVPNPGGAPIEAINNYFAFSTADGQSAFVANSLVATNVADGTNIIENSNFHKLLSVADASFEFGPRPSNKAPTILYETPDVEHTRISIRFDGPESNTGVMKFSAPAPSRLAAALLPAESAGAFGITMNLSSSYAGKTLTGVRISSPDQRILEELARTGSYMINPDGSIIITTPEIMESLNSAGTASVSFVGVAPYEVYSVLVEPEGVGYRRSEDSQLYNARMVLNIPESEYELSSGGNTAVTTVAIPESRAKELITEEDMPVGPHANYYLYASRIFSTFSLGQLNAVPEGWTAFHRVVNRDGYVIAETSEDEITLVGINPQSAGDIGFIDVYVGPGESRMSETVWNEYDIIDEWPAYAAPSLGNHVLLRADSSLSNNCGDVYDLAAEIRLDTVDEITGNRSGLVLYPGISLERDNLGEHLDHIAEGMDAAMRLMSESESWAQNDGSIITGTPGYNPPAAEEWTTANDWSGAFAQHGYLGIYFHHFHCEKPILKSRSIVDPMLIARVSTHIPVVASDVPRVAADGDGSSLADNEYIAVKKISGSETHLPIDVNSSLSTTITPTFPVTEAQEDNTSAVFDLKGRRLSAEPSHGLYINNGKVCFRK